MAKQRTIYVCSECGEEALTWQGKCPVCGAWNSFKEFKVDAKPAATRGGSSSGTTAELQPLDISGHMPEKQRLHTTISELDRVLGGGLVRGSILLLGGEPGIGKSTLLLQLSDRLSKDGTVCYFSGEESAQQVAGRAQRLGLSPTFLFANETRLPVIRQTLLTKRPEVAIIDSIQTLYDDAFPSTPGSLVQVRECALQLQELAKQEGITIILVGHITKEGTVAGPKTLEHMVDVVLYLEGEARNDTRILRSMKNRFGATDEVGLFRLGEKGMEVITNPSALFIEEHTESIEGTALTAVLEGARPILVEVQALVVPTAFGYPKRTSSGFDLQRLHIILAILESRVGCSLASSDVFLNVVGGYRIQDRGADLAVALAILSAASHVALPSKHVFYGEVGLTGEVRRVPAWERREKEVSQLGYSVTSTVKTLRELGVTLGVLKARRNT